VGQVGESVEASAGKVGLALAGGGPEGAVYEIGALRALDEALEGVDLNDLHIYIGVSAGAFLAANLANNLTPTQMCRAIVKHDPGEHPFISETFLRPALRELAGRGAMVPRLLWESIYDYLKNPRDLRLLDSLTRVGRALPVGVFDNEPIRAYLKKIYSIKGRSDDFRKLGKHLVVVAVDLDSGEAVRFGEPGLEHVPISVAVQASTAFPGLYPPVDIDGRHYVDGVLRKTLHASVALDAGAKLVLCLNPIVPVDTRRAVEAGVMRRGKLIHRGWPSVVSQMFRTLIHSRLEVGLKAYEERYDGADVILLEPRADDYRMFFTNIFSFSSRRYVCDHAYQATRRELWERRKELAPVLARHGIRLRVDVLEEERDLWDGVGVGKRPKTAVLTELEQALDRLDAYVSDHSS
jgi:predicted acylesterase/phospholipase RssA